MAPTSKQRSQTATPATPVEARSLSAITGIASNPPAYPRNPTVKKLDPLVLYIVRVPGKRDVFLTPVKPPTKSRVSVDAVNASLFYLHAATPDDEALLSVVISEQERQQQEAQKTPVSSATLATASPTVHDLVRLNNIRRKPVATEIASRDDATRTHLANAIANTPTTTTTTRPTTQQQHGEPNGAGLGVSELPPPIPPRHRAHVFESPNSQGKESSNPRSPSCQTLPPRRPLPLPLPLPQPQPQTPRSTRAEKSPAADEKSIKTPNRWSGLSGYLARRAAERESAGRDETGVVISNASYTSGGPFARESIERRRSSRQSRQWGLEAASDVHLTLIRRDPAHGVQWNAAAMSSARSEPGAVDIEIITPGYSRFASRAADYTHHGRSGASLGGSASSRVFHRRLHVSRSGDDVYARSSPSADANSNADARLKSGYYTFTSPWDGICTFTASVNGRSLKCKHMIPSVVSGASGLHGGGGGGGLDGHSAVTVAELRFNTAVPFQSAQSPREDVQFSARPGRHSHSKSKSKSKSKSNHSYSYSQTTSVEEHTGNTLHTTQRSNSLSRLARSSEEEEDDDDDDDEDGDRDSNERLDLSLARELAGGGLRGKSAKLGKLIVEDEGIKMLDLVVAACMTVWWKRFYG